MTSALDLTTGEIERIRAEENEPDSEPEPEPAPEPEPEPEPQAVGEKELKALGRVFDTYTAGLKRVMGADFETLHECPTCSLQVPGFVFEIPSPLEQFRVSERYRACPDCDGYGQVRSGAKNVNALVNCPRCFGNGWEEVPQLVAVPSPGVAAGTVPPGYLAPSSEAMPTQDQWGRTLGHPHFGIPPASIGA